MLFGYKDKRYETCLRRETVKKHVIKKLAKQDNLHIQKKHN